MTLEQNDLIISDHIIRDLTAKQQSDVVNILDNYLVPRLWSDDFEISTSTENGADLHILHGETEILIKNYVEQALNKKFEKITDESELEEVAKAQNKLGRSAEFD